MECAGGQCVNEGAVQGGTMKAADTRHHRRRHRDQPPTRRQPLPGAHTRDGIATHGPHTIAEADGVECVDRIAEQRQAGPGCGRIGSLLEDGDIVAIVRQASRNRQTADAGADHAYPHMHSFVCCHLSREVVSQEPPSRSTIFRALSTPRSVHADAGAGRTPSWVSRPATSMSIRLSTKIESR
mgnify:CR=1 FL=1